MPADSLFRRENVEQPADTVRRIAAALNVCEAVFSDDEATESGLDPTREVLRAWHSLKHVADRQRLLAFRQSLAAGRH